MQRAPLIFSLALVSFVSSCTAPPANRLRGVTAWGTMREVLREGKSEGRVGLMGIATSQTVGVGALAGLVGEITIVDGRVLVATARNGTEATEGAPVTRGATTNDQAALLVIADVAAWDEIELGACGSYEELDRAIAKQLRLRQVDPTEPTPVRIRGTAKQVELHVIAGACPVASPSGPAPWRHRCHWEQVELIGFYVEGAAGRLTHHTHNSHLHVVAGDRLGHVDEVAMHEAVLMLPAQSPGADR